MALSKIDAANFLTGTIPQGNVANASLGAVTSLPAAIATGKVLQVVSAKASTETTTSSSSGQDIVSASITPSSTSNKIFIICGVAGIRRDNTSGYMAAQVTDKGSFGEKFGHAMMYTSGSSHLRLGTANASFLVSPSTTSSKTYYVQFYNPADSGNVTIGDNNDCESTITLMEIEA